jgi:hypothetical protein
MENASSEMKESDCTGGEEVLQGVLADCGKLFLHEASG